MASKITEGRELFNAWATAYRMARAMADAPAWERFDRAEETAWDTLIDTVEASHDALMCPCLACQVWRSESPATMIKGA
jgi:hypothetical protein